MHKVDEAFQTSDHFSFLILTLILFIQEHMVFFHKCLVPTSIHQ